MPVKGRRVRASNRPSLGSEGYLSARKVLDAHLHAYEPEKDPPTDWVENGFGAFRDWPGTYVRTSAELEARTIQEMDAAGVRLGLLSHYNRAVRKWVADHPSRFLPSYFPSPTVGDDSWNLEEFKREAHEGFWRALGEVNHGWMVRPLEDPLLFPYYDVCEREGLPIMMHTGPDAINNYDYDVSLTDPLRLRPVLRQFPRLRFVLYHMGWPNFDHGLYMSYAFANVYLEVGAVVWLFPKLTLRMVRETIDAIGSDRLLFGTDQMLWPQMISKSVEIISNAPNLSQEEKKQILWENSANLFRAESV
jgi:uncharacterized protein